MQVRIIRGRKSIEAEGTRYPRGARSVLNYDVDKTAAEDTSPEISTFRYRVLSRVRSRGNMRIISVMRNIAVNSDQRKRAITRSPWIRRGNLRIVAASSCK